MGQRSMKSAINEFCCKFVFLTIDFTCGGSHCLPPCVPIFPSNITEVGLHISLWHKVELPVFVEETPSCFVRLCHDSKINSHFVQFSVSYRTALSSRWQCRLEFFFFSSLQIDMKAQLEKHQATDISACSFQSDMRWATALLSENMPVTPITLLHRSLINRDAGKGRRSPVHARY